MPSSLIEKRPTRDGGSRYRVRFVLGGRETRTGRYAGSFKTKAEALARKRWVDGELAAMRVPEIALVRAESKLAPTLREAAQRWIASRIDVKPNTLAQFRCDVARALPALGERRIDAITAGDVAELIAKLAQTRKRETVKKTLQALAMTFDHAGVVPNPAREKAIVKLPREARPEISPPTIEHLLPVFELLPSKYRLPFLVLDGTGMRLGELEHLVWGDVDEARVRWRVSAAVSKTGRARWVNVPPVLFAAVGELCPRDDRTPTRRVFEGFRGDPFRTAIARACTATAVPAFSPHDLRHRRISLLHAGGTPWARIGEHVGQRNLAVTANTYTHVLIDERELDYTELLARSTPMYTPQRAETAV